MIPIIKMIPINKIKDNPYRDRRINPIEVESEKVENLVESIGATGLWIGIYGRELPSGDVELAFGHTRVEAAKQLGLKEIPVTIENFSDSDMLMRMSRENSDTKYIPPVMMEAVSGAVRALAEDKISLPPLDPKTHKEYIRYAPYFTPGKMPSEPEGGSHAYTVDSIATFLGYIKKKTGRAKNSVVAAFDALELIEKKIIKPSQVGGFATFGQAMSSIKKRTFDRTTEGKKVQATIQANTEKMAKLDEDRRAEEAKAKTKQAELLKRELEARAEEDAKEAQRLNAERIRVAEQAEARAKVFQENRAALDAKVKKAEERAEQSRVQNRDLPTRHAVKTLLFKLNTIVSEHNSFRDELKAIARDRAVTQAEREIIRQAILAAATWYEEQAIQFRPVVQGASK